MELHALIKFPRFASVQVEAEDGRGDAEGASSSSLSISLKVEMEKADPPETLGARGLRGLQEMQLWAERLVPYQPGQLDCRQPIDDHALSWLAHGGDDDAWECCQQEKGVGEEDPLSGQKRSGERQWWCPRHWS